MALAVLTFEARLPSVLKKKRFIITVGIFHESCLCHPIDEIDRTKVFV